MNKSLLACFVAVAAFAPFLLSNSSGPGGNRTGSPGSAGTCQGCHGGTADLGASLSARIIDKATSTVVTRYEPGKSYTVELISTGGTSTKRGFQFTLVDAAGKTQGTFTNPSANCGISSSGNASIVGHTSPGTGSSWTCDWTAPSSGASDLTLHAVSICSNSNGNNGGDQFSKLTQVFSVNTASVESVISPEFHLVNHPSEGLIRWSQEVDFALLYNVQGQLVLKANNVKELDATELPKGNYTLLLTNGYKSSRQRVILP
ncbi:MAG: hypothetical protein RL577_1465 [Bacteroidota bacterium]|jgi:hypothetical protein